MEGLPYRSTSCELYSRANVLQARTCAYTNAKQVNGIPKSMPSKDPKPRRDADRYRSGPPSVRETWEFPTGLRALLIQKMNPIELQAAREARALLLPQRWAQMIRGDHHSQNSRGVHVDLPRRITSLRVRSSLEKIQRLEIRGGVRTTARLRRKGLG